MVISRTEASCQELTEEHPRPRRDRFVRGGRPDRCQSRPRSRQRRRWLDRVDGLFNVAGGTGRRLGDGPLHTLDADACERTMRLNATSHDRGQPPVLRAMLEQEPDPDGIRGAIVNMGSVLASQPVPELFATHAYAAAKGAIAALTVSSAAYYASRGIRVNMVAPALTTSRMSERAAADPVTQAFSRRKQPLGRWLRASRGHR